VEEEVEEEVGVGENDVEEEEEEEVVVEMVVVEEDAAETEAAARAAAATEAARRAAAKEVAAREARLGGHAAEIPEGGRSPRRCSAQRRRASVVEIPAGERRRQRATEKMLRPWSQQARQLTPQRRTVSHLGNQGCCVHIHTGNLSRARADHWGGQWAAQGVPTSRPSPSQPQLVRARTKSQRARAWRAKASHHVLLGEARQRVRPMMMICLSPQGTPPPTQQPTWPTAHTAHSQHCGHTVLPPGRKTNSRRRLFFLAACLLGSLRV